MFPGSAAENLMTFGGVAEDFKASEADSAASFSFSSISLPSAVMVQALKKETFVSLLN